MRCCAFVTGFLFVASIFLATTTAVQGDVISYWNCDEASGNVLDSVGTRHGSLGTAVTRVAGTIGSGALEIDHTGGGYTAVDTGAQGVSFTSGFTAEALVRLPSSGWLLDSTETENLNTQVIFGTNSGAPLFWFQHDQWTNWSPPRPHETVLSFAADTGGWHELDMPLDGVDGRPSIADMTDGNYHHLVATYDVATGKKALYVDGTERLSASFTPGTPFDTDTNHSLMFGGIQQANYNLQGTIDEVALYDSALSASDVLVHYQNFQAGQNYFIPEPSAMALLVMGLFGLLACAWRQRK